MGHAQPKAPMQTDNSTEHGVINSIIMHKATKSMDTRFHWFRDRECQKQLWVYWRPGTTNLGDYWRNHQSGKQHQNVLPEIITLREYLDSLKQVLATRESVQTPLVVRVF